MTPSQASATSSSGIHTPIRAARKGLVDRAPPTHRSKPGPCSGCSTPTKETSLISGAPSRLGWPLTDVLNLRGRLADRKSTRLNSSHVSISYAVFCLKKKKEDQ